MRCLPARLPSFLLAFMLAACGGGGGGNGGGGMTANSAPVFTSPTTVTTPENTAGVIYNATASDGDGDAVSLSITGGADAALFQINAAGALSFVVSPDFEVPGDVDSDNVYRVTISVSDGGASTAQTLSITVTDDAGGGFAVRRIATGLTQPVYLTAFPDGSGRVLVVERAGRILILDPATGNVAATPFLDIGGQVSTVNERGLLSVAFDPDYMSNGRAYVHLTALDGAVELRRFTSPANNRDALDPATSDVLLTVPHPRSNHNGGWLGFDDDGLLYMSIGDGGGGNDPDRNGQNTSVLLGKILRLDVTRDDFPNDPARDYGIPEDNPFANGGGAGEVCFYGLRNPYRNSFDRATGELWIGDVGQGAIEEIDRAAAGQCGLNYGWSIFEGTQPLNGTDPTGITMPVVEYAHGTGPFQGNSLTGGYVYRGPIEPLQGLYIFADFISNNIWSVPVSALPQGSTAAAVNVLTNRNADFAPDVGSLARITSFGEDQEGNLYIVTFGGEVFAIVPSS